MRLNYKEASSNLPDVQLPIMMGMYYATMRAASVVYGSFFGLPFSGTPIDGFTQMQFGYIIIYVLMIVCQLLSMKMPQILKKIQDKKDHVKEKKYAEENQNSMMNTMNTTMYFSTAMIAFLYISWPIAMSFYWLVSSIIRIIHQAQMDSQRIIAHCCFPSCQPRLFDWKKRAERPMHGAL